MEINVGNYYINRRLQPMSSMEYNEGALKNSYKYKSTLITSRYKTEILFNENGESNFMNRSYNLIKRINYSGAIGIYTDFELKNSKSFIVNKWNNEIHIQSISKYLYQKIESKRLSLQNAIIQVETDKWNL